MERPQWNDPPLGCRACSPSQPFSSPRRYQAAGFTLVEMLLAFSLGMALCGAMLQVLLVQGRQGDGLVRLLREKAFQRRTLELMRGDLLRAQQLTIAGAEAPPCPLGVRQPLLQIQTDAGSILYTLGPPPSEIWRGWVLMRCGPAFGLDGELSRGEPLNRVVLDGLAAGGVAVEPRGPGLLRLQLRQQLPLGGGGSQTIRSSLEVPTALVP